MLGTSSECFSQKRKYITTMAKQVNDQPIKTKVKNADKEQKQKNREARDKKRAAAVAAKMKARSEAEEKGLPWNDTIPAARFLEDYDKAFMSAIAGEAKVSPPVDPDVVAGVHQDPEAEQAPVQTEKTSAQLTLEAARKHNEELLAAANENDNEEAEAPTTTGVSVTTEENPESDTSAEEAPTEEDKSGPIPTIDLNDPSTWPLETNGGLMRLPGESGKKYSSRKHKHKLWKREQAKLTETRNGEPPTPSEINKTLPVDDTTETKRYPEGELDYHSDHDGQSVQLPKPEKSAAESANVFEAAAMGQTDEPATVVEDETPAEEAETNQPQPDDAGSTEGTEVPDAAPVDTKQEPAEQETPPVVETAKPILTLASSQSDDEALTNRAQKFYGSTWTAERAEKLTKAFKFLEMAIRLQQKGESDSRVNMPMTSAIRLETEALGIAVAIAKAA